MEDDLGGGGCVEEDEGNEDIVVVLSSRGVCNYQVWFRG